jgi:hypothetical protein
VRVIIRYSAVGKQAIGASIKAGGYRSHRLQESGAQASSASFSLECIVELLGAPLV